MSKYGYEEYGHGLFQGGILGETQVNHEYYPSWYFKIPSVQSPPTKKHRLSFVVQLTAVSIAVLYSVERQDG
jgi:hypothetical protein